MPPETLFVVAVASEKGGVGKTTIATNLAVYLKALREDLPVTIASFDNHFSVDSMFAIGRSTGSSVARLLAGDDPAELAQMGEYGVQFLASERALAPPDENSATLSQLLAVGSLRGILILDTRPILDYFTASALAAADLVLVPVKDRPSLVNAASLHQLLQDEPERMWLLPSLVDARLRLREDIGMRDFLVAAGRERGYQVLETFIAKSPKVEGLATNLTSRVYPVLTHARGTVVHRQFRELADFVLEQQGAIETPRSLRYTRAQQLRTIPAGRQRRLLAECPHCGEGRNDDQGSFVFDCRSRRRAFLHHDCVTQLLTSLGAEEKEGRLLSLTPPDVGDTREGLLVSWFDAEGLLLEQERCECDTGFALWSRLSGRSREEAYRETLLLILGPEPPLSWLEADGALRLSRLRRQARRELLAFS